MNIVKTRLAVMMLLCLGVGACASSEQTRLANQQAQALVDDLSNQIQVQQEQIQNLEGEFQSLSSSLNTQYERICSQTQNELAEELKARNTQLKSLRREHKDLQKVCEDEQAQMARFEGKLLLGEIENITLVKEEVRLSARIDTGAETSSLGVYQQQLFERDGRSWVRFALSPEEEAQRYEYRIRGRASIKQSAVSEGEERVEIRLTIQLGDKTYKRQTFNLADRSYLEHQLLIGRSFLTDIAVVDTAAKYLLGRE